MTSVVDVNDDVNVAKLALINELFDWFVVESDNKFDELTAVVAHDVAESIRKVGIRDGALKLFSELGTESMLHAITNASGVAARLSAVTTDDNKNDVYYFDLVVAGFMYLYIGRETKAKNTNPSIDSMIKILKSFVAKILECDENISLNKLYDRAINGGVPHYIFLESIEAVPMQDILDSIKE
jgi:hypothetical protein